MPGKNGPTFVCPLCGGRDATGNLKTHKQRCTKLKGLEGDKKLEEGKKIDEAAAQAKAGKKEAKRKAKAAEKEEVKKHNEAARLEGIGNQRTFKCEQCNIVLQDERKLDRHNKTATHKEHEKANEPFKKYDHDTVVALDKAEKKCHMCSRDFSRHEDLVRHLKTKVHKKTIKPRKKDKDAHWKPERKKCGTCYQGYRYYQNFERHEQSMRHMKAARKFAQESYDKYAAEERGNVPTELRRVRCHFEYEDGSRTKRECGESVLRKHFGDHLENCHKRWQPYDMIGKMEQLVKDLEPKKAKEISEPKLAGKRKFSGDTCLTGRGFKNFLKWRATTGNADPGSTNVADVMQQSRPGAIRVKFSTPEKPRRKAFEGWADATGMPKRRTEGLKD